MVHRTMRTVQERPGVSSRWERRRKSEHPLGQASEADARGQETNVELRELLESQNDCHSSQFKARICRGPRSPGNVLTPPRALVHVRATAILTFTGITYIALFSLLLSSLICPKIYVPPPPTSHPFASSVSVEECGRLSGSVSQRRGLAAANCTRADPVSSVGAYSKFDRVWV